MTEATIRAAHHAQQDGVVGGHGGICRCSCGATWRDDEFECPVLEAALEAFAHARLDDDGAPSYSDERSKPGSDTLLS